MDLRQIQILVEEREAQRAAVQSDLDDLLLVLGDLEEKSAKYKVSTNLGRVSLYNFVINNLQKRLLDLGVTVSDCEED
jgi:hypothetical protein